jgi:hypothetical protein
MDRLRRLAVASILVLSCSGLNVAGPDPSVCTPFPPDTVTTRWPDALTLVLGSADEVWVGRSVEDGCSYLEIPFTALTIGTRDSTVASPISSASDGLPLTIVPSRPGRTWVVFEAADLMDSIRVSVPDTFALAGADALAAGGAQSCAMEGSGRIMCWGGDQSELLGGQGDPAVGTCHGAPCSPMPKPVDIQAEQLFLGFEQHCFRNAAGLTCRRWGSDETVSDPALTSVSIGGNHVCGLTAGGEAHCWGSNDVGQLGDGQLGTPASAPRPVRGSQTWVSLDARLNSTCGVTSEGHLYCWGALPADVSGTGTCEVSVGGKGADPVYGPCTNIPFRIPMGGGLDGDTLLAEVAARCLRTTGGGVLCAPDGRTRFWRVASPGSFSSIGAGSRHFCGLTAGGEAQCWGSNDLGQLGSSRADSDVPAPVDGGHVFTDLALGDVHSCGLTASAEVWCWGGNRQGQVSGSILDPRVVLPRKVRGQGGS